MTTSALRFALLVPALLLVAPVAVSCVGSDSITDEGASEGDEAIARSDAIARAEEWVSAKLEYCQSPNGARDYDSACSSVCHRASNAAWDPYRSDCSGLVSWAWGLPAPGRVTGEFAPYETDISSTITATSLQPGDAVNSDDHIILFKAWVTPGKEAVFIEEPGCSSSTPYAHEFTSSVTTSGSSIYISYEGKSFTAIRYKGISSDVTPPPPPPAPKAAVEVAFQANTSDLWTTGTAGTKDWKLGMMTSTSPAIAADASGGYEVAFQANTGNLWIVDSAGHGGDQHLGMLAGTSPAIAYLVGGGYQVAFQANTGNLWTTGTDGTKDLGLGMMRGTSPSITALWGGGYEIAFQANTSDLWTTGTAGTKDWRLGMMAGSSPAIAGLTNGSFEVAFEANTTSLWVVNSAGGGGDQGLGMYSGTSPAITALPSAGWEVAFEANTTDLWTHGTAGTKDWALGMMHGTSPTIATLASGAYQVSFEANTANLWTVSSAGGGGDQHLGMMSGTSPSTN